MLLSDRHQMGSRLTQARVLSIKIVAMISKSIAKRVGVIFLSLFLIFVFIVVLLGWGGIIRARHVQVNDRIASSPKTGFYVAAEDTRMFVQRVGQSNAPVVMFVHGTGAWSEIWRPYMNQVAGMGYQAMAIDLPPFGYSIPPKSGSYDRVAQAKRILSALDSMGIQQATFVSHSIGSGPLMEALLRQPGRVTKLVLVSPALGLDSPRTDGPESIWQRLLRERWFTEPVSASILTNPLFTTALVKYFVVEKDKVTDEWVNLYRQPLSLSGSYQNVALWLPELLARRTALKSDNPEFYKSITFPVVLIWGTSDPITPMSQAEHLHALIPGSELVVLPGGHVPMIEEPEQFSALLAKALRRIQ